MLQRFSQNTCGLGGAIRGLGVAAQGVGGSEIWVGCTTSRSKNWSVGGVLPDPPPLAIHIVKHCTVCTRPTQP